MTRKHANILSFDNDVFGMRTGGFSVMSWCPWCLRQGWAIDQSNVCSLVLYGYVFFVPKHLGMPTLTILEQNRTVVVWRYIYIYIYRTIIYRVLIFFCVSLNLSNCFALPTTELMLIILGQI